MTEDRLFPVGVTIDDDRNEWYTPAWLFDAIGLTFDLDVCAPEDRQLVSTPAQRFLTATDDGLTSPWAGLVWCNPPYSDAGPWARRMIDHGSGLLLSHVPINGGWCLDVWRSCGAITMFGGMHFARPDGSTQRPAWWLQLASFGAEATSALEGIHDRLPPTMDDRWRPGPVWRQMS